VSSSYVSDCRIEAETTGTIVKFLAENGKSVTPGQPLVLIKP